MRVDSDLTRIALAAALCKAIRKIAVVKAPAGKICSIRSEARAPIDLFYRCGVRCSDVTGIFVFRKGVEPDVKLLKRWSIVIEN